MIRCNWVDILFVTIVIRICWVGFKTGLFPEFFRFLGLGSAFIFSFNSYTLLSDFISRHTSWTGIKLDVVSFLFIFVGILLVCKIFVSVSSIFFNWENISVVNRLMGLVIGMGRGILLVGLIYTLFVNCPLEFLSNSAKEKSFSAKYSSGILPYVYKIGINFYPWKKVETPLVGLLRD